MKYASENVSVMFLLLILDWHPPMLPSKFYDAFVTDALHYIYSSVVEAYGTSLFEVVPSSGGFMPMKLQG